VLPHSQREKIAVMNTLADRLALQWAGIERAMKFANSNPAFRPQVESVVDSYFTVIDEMVSEIERGHMKQGES
jgi:hypothetical protein